MSEDLQQSDYDRWERYQVQITGWLSASDGARPVYMQTHESGATVVFSGRTLRQNGQLEVFLEPRMGFHLLAQHPGYLRVEEPENAAVALLGAAAILEEARQQVTVLPEGSVLEWHFADAYGGAGVRRLLEKAMIFDIDVFYTPEVGQ